MSSSFFQSAEYASLAVKDIERALLRTLGVHDLPATPQAAASYPANYDPFWYRSMYMLAILAEEPHWMESGHEEWTTRNIVLTLAMALETRLIAALSYRRLKRRLRLGRWGYFKDELEVARFLERVEPEILVLLAGSLAHGHQPLIRPAKASDSIGFRNRLPPRHRLVEVVQRAAAEKGEPQHLSLASYVIDFIVRYLAVTPRGNYNLACYFSDGAGRAQSALDRRLWIEDAARFLFDGLSGLDIGMDAWARVDPDLQDLRLELDAEFEDLMSSAAGVRAAGLEQPASQPTH
jgi:hypothetical protein